MVIVDANIILRYLLADSADASVKAQEIIERQPFFLPTEVLAEVVYVLERVYHVERALISTTLLDFLNNPQVNVSNLLFLQTALAKYKAKKLDFVDLLLYGYHKVDQVTIMTFDQKLNKLLQGR